VLANAFTYAKRTQPGAPVAVSRANRGVAHRAPVVVVDLADPDVVRWPAYGPAMLAHQIRGVYAMLVVAGQCVGALGLFRAHPGVLGAEQLAGALVAAELAQMPLLGVLAEDLQAAVADPDSDSWAELNTLSRAEVSQATGMLVAQLEVEPAEALVRLRAHAFATGHSGHRRRPRHPGSPTTPGGRLMRAHRMLDSGSVAYRRVTGAEWSRS
jgi:hypothetical protein